jgi:hypothetical protein
MRGYTACLLFLGITKRNVMVCALSYLWDETAKIKILLIYLIWKSRIDKAFPVALIVHRSKLASDATIAVRLHL